MVGKVEALPLSQGAHSLLVLYVEGSTARRVDMGTLQAFAPAGAVILTSQAMEVGAGLKVSTTTTPNPGGEGGRKDHCWLTVIKVGVADTVADPDRTAFSSSVPPEVNLYRVAEVGRERVSNCPEDWLKQPVKEPSREVKHGDAPAMENKVRHSRAGLSP